MGTSDIIAVLWFIILWSGFSQSTQPWHGLGRRSLSQRMNAYRRAWFRVAARRDLRMIDTAILGGLQNGTAFFASTTIFAIGGCFALLGATEEVLSVFRTLPLEIEPSPVAFEIKVIGLTALFAYAFFKFGWAYRLFNYSSILFGAIPPASVEEEHPGTLDAHADRAADMNILAGQSFNAGLRAIFMSIGYLGWFAGPMVLMASSLLVIVVLLRRQFFSPAHDAAVAFEPDTRRQ
jgi:uncharacterized membrane protein